MGVLNSQRKEEHKMISVIMTLHNRAHLLKWCLEGIYRNSFPEDKKVIEINILDDGSTDGLDDLLQRESERFGAINKYIWDKSKLEIPIKFNCPAQAYNLLVKLSSYDIIYKTDPEMVILDKDFIKKSLDILNMQSDAIIMPFPYHCYEFPINQFEEIEKNYLKYYYSTHITKENARSQMIYYQSIFSRESFITLGGIEERFSSGIGYEDVSFLKWWRKIYGEQSFVPLVSSPCIHQYHGGMAQTPDKGTVGVPPHLYPWVEQNERLGVSLENVRPNSGIKWGKKDSLVSLDTWVNGCRQHHLL